MHSSIFFNAHHAPVGAFATFTLGCKGARGGLGLELGKPADESFYIGLEDESGSGLYQAFPFYSGGEQAEQDYDVEGLSDLRHANSLTPFADDSISRTLGAGIDEWKANDLTLRIISPPRAVPDPDLANAKDALAPCVLVEIEVDNRQGKSPRRAFFGYAGSDRTVGMRILDEPGLVGVGQGTSIAIASRDEGLYAGLGWQPEAILSPHLTENLGFMLGSIGLIVGVVEPGEIRTFRFSVAFFREGTATTGLRTRYLYRRWFDRVEDVLHHGLDRFEDSLQLAKEFDAKIASSLGSERAFMAAHAIRSFFGSTQLLEREDGRPLWVVHEGEYRMMNTFDLTVDQAFFELALNPWTVRNVLDLFVERYSYQDDLRFPGNPEPQPGGITFTHDMGVANAFSKPGYSGYEQAGLHGCFSYMSGEELVNWVLTAGLYYSHTGDLAWLTEHSKTLKDCLRSLQNRDNPDESLRNGVIGLDANRCLGGAEITTYDSLDASLGQARNNLYLAVKCWAAYLALEKSFNDLGQPELARESATQAERAAITIAAAADEAGLLPAVIGEGIDARIIPAIEGLVYPFVMGIVDERFNWLKQTLDRHFIAAMDSGLCRFKDGGWRLSSTSRNSWLSKIYLCQFVAENILGHQTDTKADQAHGEWLRDDDNGYFAWSDQMLDGKAVGSRYYPRGVTSILWMTRGKEPLKDVATLFSASSQGAEVRS